MDFHGIDLNLLAAFDALVNERNVTRAAARVGVSQPAMSAALSRLRTLFNDQLFLRTAHGLLMTPKARDLAEPVSQALRQIESALLPNPRFEPEKASITFTLGLSEYPAFVLLPILVKALEKLGPGISLAVHAIGSRDSAVDLLDAGTIDAAVGAPPNIAEKRILSKPVMRDEFITIVRRNHPAVQQEMDMQTFLKLSHVLVSPEGDRYGMVDQALAHTGKRRKLGLTLPQMFTTPSVVAQTDMVATVMRRIAQHSRDWRKLTVFTPPVPIPEMVFDLMWHKRNDTHPAQQWLREQIARVAGSL
ncbi:LysR family transcriptional regulator [Undibacterium sp. TJN19]|uniref:LysR family transcriptional regulator n=1 Tax=Undibacterium sp. TJN19 TaxID=3413055 RepID=UPI003BF41269